MKTRLFKLLSICMLFFLTVSTVFAQDTITLKNPSFEDMPRHSKQPKGWFNCGPADESAPDVQPNGGFGVKKPAAEGQTYLGLIVRDNDTWESVGQKLSKPLNAGECYDFSLLLARSENYLSMSRTTEGNANYITPVIIRIFGGNSFCDRLELLDESELVENTNWTQYNFRFQLTENCNYIVLEAYYKTSDSVSYNGNILVDGASDIISTDCDSEYIRIKEIFLDVEEDGLIKE